MNITMVPLALTGVSHVKTISAISPAEIEVKKSAKSAGLVNIVTNPFVRTDA
jgi:hypothetical protein